MTKLSEQILKHTLADILAELKVHNWIMCGDQPEEKREECVRKLSPVLLEGRSIEELEDEISNMTVYGSRNEAELFRLKITRGYINSRIVRKKLGITQEEFAKKLGVSVSVVQKWDTGARSPGKYSIEKIKQLQGE